MKKGDKAGFQAYGWFFKFLSLFNTKEGKHPESVDKDNLPSVLAAHLNNARIFGKMFAEGNPQLKIHWMTESLKEYKFIVAFGEKNIPAALEEAKREAQLDPSIDVSQLRPIFQDEIAHCREMIALLPKKIDELHYKGNDIDGSPTKST